jgi:hypothetical protein
MPQYPNIPVTPYDLTLGWVLAAFDANGSNLTPTPISLSVNSVGEGLSASGVLTQLSRSGYGLWGGTDNLNACEPQSTDE